MKSNMNNYIAKYKMLRDSHYIRFLNLLVLLALIVVLFKVILCILNWREIVDTILNWSWKDTAILSATTPLLLWYSKQ